MELLVRELCQCKSWAQECEVRLCGFRRRQGQGGWLSQGQVKVKGGLAPFEDVPAEPVPSLVIVTKELIWTRAETHPPAKLV